MSSYCNSIFFSAKNVTIDDLQQHMLTTENKGKEQLVNDKEEQYMELVKEEKPEIECIPEIESNPIILDPEPVKQTVSNPVKTIVSEPLSTVSPTQHDTLFWCIYIAVFGHNDYLEISRNYGVKELEIKKQVADFIQKNPTSFKHTNHKVTKVAIQEILSELLTSQKETSNICLLAMIVKYNINILLVDPTNRFYLEYYSNIDMKENQTYVIQKNTFGKYNLQIEPIYEPELTTWKSSKLPLVSYIKPLHAISTYKLQELVELAKKYGIYDAAKKYKKADLYNDVCDVIRWR
uniref:Uncharacterized protein n=1 Tax=viral metagenome TaxID=1070528 RepID=A0A6C0ASJ7_9ZZZZ